ncbi:uncharacterized protein METZ01_LOCUS111699 [marine metagenome]|uniref:Uncharacterized protein n=1 Tax=marine metagenome TaxID=408172 RepID=A0A381X288_9ZZZZ
MQGIRNCLFLFMHGQRFYHGDGIVAWDTHGRYGYYLILA